MPLPADTGRIWAAVPPFGRNAYSGNRFARDEKKSRKNKIATSPRSADCCPCPSAATDWRDGFTHLRVGQAERLACRWQPNAFCGLAPAPTLGGPRVEGQREETRCCPAIDFVPSGFRYAVAKEAIFSLSWNPNKSAPVWPCEALCRVNGGSVAPESPVVFPSPLRAAFAETSESLSLTPSCSYECPDNSSRNPWLSEKNSGMACFPATPYQNFYVREEAEA